MFTSSQKKLLKEASKYGALTIKGFNQYGIPFMISGELADSKNSNCLIPITDTDICITMHIPEEVPITNYGQQFSANMHESRNIFIQFTSAFGANNSLDSAHLYIDCILDNNKQIIYVNEKALLAKKNILDIRRSFNDTYIENLDNVDDVSKALNNLVGKLVFLDDPVKKSRVVGVPVVCTYSNSVGQSKAFIQKNKTILLFNINPYTKLYSIDNKNVTLVAENNLERITELQKMRVQKPTAPKSETPSQLGDE